MQLLTLKDQKARKGMLFEQEDHRTDDCVVQCFKKVSNNNTHLRMNCFVTQFEFSKRAGEADDEPQSGVQDTLENCDEVHAAIKQEQRACEDPDMQQAPFVYLMNKVKYAQMEKKAQDNTTYLEVKQRFSMFNR
jgi:hypothetical protein